MVEMERVKQSALTLKINVLQSGVEKYIHTAQIDKPSYIDFLKNILDDEILVRQQKKMTSLLKRAHLPSDHNLDKYDFSHFNGISKPEMKQLRELVWMDNCYNLVLMGPPGVGKTYLAAGLVHDAAKMGYKSYFKTMEELLEILKYSLMDRSVFYQTIIERFNLTQVAIDILDQELYEESLNKGEHIVEW